MTLTLEEKVARLLCRQRGIDPDVQVISGPLEKPTDLCPTWHFWRADAVELIALIMAHVEGAER